MFEDMIIGGYGTIEPRLTPYYKRPIKLWGVDGTTIRIYADWSESMPDKPLYAQLTGLKGERGIISFLQKELVYIKTNSRTSTPFGLGNLEVSFNAVNGFLGAQDMASKSAADQVHRTWLWFTQSLPPGQVQTARRHIQNEIEGQGKLSMMAGLPKPETVEVTPVTEEDLLLNWQELLIRIIALGFDLSPLALGIERDVNRSTSEILSEMDFKSAVVPKAVAFAEALNRHIIWGLLDWRDVQFEWIGLDDPDAQTQQEINQLLYNMNAITPDEVRAKEGKPPLPGGWGKLTLGMYQILQMSARATGQGSGPGGSAGAGALQRGPGIPPQELAQMEPEEIEQLVRMGVIPNPADEGEPQTGVLDQMTKQIAQFLEETAGPRPAKSRGSNPGAEKEQLKKYKNAEHVMSREEKMSRDIEKRRQSSLLERPKIRKRRGTSATDDFTGRTR